MPSPAVSAASPLSRRCPLAKAGASRRPRILLLAVLFCCIHGSRTFAAPTYSVTGKGYDMDFATLQKPSSGSQTFTISTSGATSGTGTLLYGSTSVGTIGIKCSGACSGKTITIDIPPYTGNCGETHSFTVGVEGSGENDPVPASGFPNPGSDEFFYIGETVTYPPSVLTGVSCNTNPTVNITGSSGGGVSTSYNSVGAFDVGVTMSKNSDINFGTVNAHNSSKYRISTAGAVSVVTGTGTTLYGSTSAANITVSGSTADSIIISTSGYTADQGVTPSNATCSYDGSAASSCDAGISVAAPGAGKTLLLGVDVAADGTQAAGTTAAPSFTVNVAYQ
jgi:hypothetical protein